MRNFSQWEYVLIAYALKGSMRTNEVTNYLCNTIKINITSSTPERSINMYVAQNIKGRILEKNHKGSWYIRIRDGEYRLDCPNDLKSRIAFVKYARDDKNHDLVFSELEFKEIIAEFLSKDVTLNKEEILRYSEIDDNFIEKFTETKVPQFHESKPAEEVIIHSENTYTRENFLSEVYITKEKYDSLVRMLKTKKNIILQGAPGVGKTFAAKRLAFSMMGEKDHSRIEFVQFHQNYSYEDFVMGYKPDGDSFTLKNGVFYEFCKKAEDDPGKEYFFIIDEINRGNMSKIFGELLMLIEKDYRGESMKLAYSEIPFSVPKNLYIIGMMNTADRSLAMIDYALRRRFSFFDMDPGFKSDGFKAYQKSFNSRKLDNLVEKIIELNQEITDDKSLGKGFCIGHSYLCDPENCAEANLKNVVEFDILPMLAEYWFDEMEIYEKWKTILTDAVK